MNATPLAENNSPPTERTFTVEPKLADSEHQDEPQDGYVLDVQWLEADQAPKLASDHRTVLIPQPSDDPNDPLNWSQTRKNVMLAVVCACTFLPDYGSVTGAVTLIPQAK